MADSTFQDSFTEVNGRRPHPKKTSNGPNPTILATTRLDFLQDEETSFLEKKLVPETLQGTWYQFQADSSSFKEAAIKKLIPIINQIHTVRIGKETYYRFNSSVDELEVPQKVTILGKPYEISVYTPPARTYKFLGVGKETLEAKSFQVVTINGETATLNISPNKVRIEDKDERTFWVSSTSKEAINEYIVNGQFLLENCDKVFKAKYLSSALELYCSNIPDYVHCNALATAYPELKATITRLPQKTTHTPAMQNFKTIVFRFGNAEDFLEAIKTIRKDSRREVLAQSRSGFLSFYPTFSIRNSLLPELYSPQRTDKAPSHNTPPIQTRNPTISQNKGYLNALTNPTPSKEWDTFKEEMKALFKTNAEENAKLIKESLEASLISFSSELKKEFDSKFENLNTRLCEVEKTYAEDRESWRKHIQEYRNALEDQKSYKESLNRRLEELEKLCREHLAAISARTRSNTQGLSSSTNHNV
jgi:hypothetical protein